MLNERQRAFAEAYVKTADATNSAKSAGYSAKSAHVIGCTLLKHTEVAAEIARLTGRIEKKSELTADRVMQELAKIALLDLGLLYDADGKPRAINDIPEDARRAISSLTDKGIKTHSKLGALELAAKIFQMVKQEQTQQTAVQITIAAPPELPKADPNRPQLLPEW